MLQLSTTDSIRAQKLIQREAPSAVKSSGVRLGPGDQIGLWVRDAEEISNRTYRIDQGGEIQVPLIGRAKVGGLSIQEIESLLAEKLKVILLEPDIHVSIAELRSKPITVNGAVKAPGLIQLREPVTLLQALTLAGGVASEAGGLVRITRRIERGTIPLTSSHPDASGGFSVAEEELQAVLDGTSEAANLIMQADDVVAVAQAPVVYVMGEVKRAGGLALSRKDHDVSVLQALAMAEGMTELASPRKAAILRPTAGLTRQMIGVDLKAVLAGKSEDLRLRPDDILFIPNNKNVAKTFAMQAAQVAASIAVGVTIVKAGRR